MKKILLTLAAVAMIFAGCESSLEDRVSRLENRVSELEAFVTNLNAEVEGIQTIVSNLQKNVYVTGVEPIKNASGVEIGYKLTFNQGNPIEIKHGNTGAVGETGAAGKTPTIDLYEGEWYWKYSGGDWIKDSQDNMIPVTEEIEFSVKDGVLYVTINGEEKALGSVKGEQGDSMFEGVTVNEEKGTVIIDLKGTDNNLVLPFNAAAADEFALELQLPSTPAVLGGKITIGYEITGCSADAAALFVYQLPEGWTAEIDSANGTIELTTNENAGKLVLFAVNNETGDTKAKFVDFDPEKLLFLDVEETAFEIPATGGSVKFPVSTGDNFNYKVISPDWITAKKTTLTKAMAYYEYELVASENDGDALREGEVKFVNSENEEEVYFTFTVSQKNYNKAIIGEYLESYTKGGMPQKGTLKIELSDDFTKGTYKVTICGLSFYADYEPGKLNVYYNKYTRTLTVAADLSKIEVANVDFGTGTISSYVALKPLGTPELTETEQALVGTYDESWKYNGSSVTSSSVMTVSASEDAAYGQLKVKFLCVNGYFAECYANLSSDGTKLVLNSYGVTHGQYVSIQQPVELAIAEDGTLTTSSIYMQTYKSVENYVATKVVQSDDENAEAGPLAGTWTVAYESTDNLYSDNGTWTSKTGTITIEGAADNYKITSFLGQSVSWALTESGNTLKYSGNFEMTLTYNETTGQLTTETGTSICDWMSFRIRNIVATKNVAEGGEGEGTEAISFAGTWNVTCEMGDAWGMSAPTATSGTMVITGSGSNYVIETIAGVAYGVSVTWDGTALSGGKNGATLTLVYDAANDTLTFTGEYKDYEHNVVKNIVATR